MPSPHSHLVPTRLEYKTDVKFITHKDHCPFHPLLHGDQNIFKIPLIQIPITILSLFTLSLKNTHLLSNLLHFAAPAAAEAAGSTDGEAIAQAVGTLSNIQTLAGAQDFTTGDGEGLHEFNIFVIDDEKYMTWDKWDGTDGYKAVMEASGLQ